MPAVDPTGKDREGKPIAALPPWPEFMQVARETPAGETSLLEETDAGGYFVIQVDEVVEPRLKPVEEVRDQLVEAWQAERRRELARQKAEQLRARLAGGAPLGGARRERPREQAARAGAPRRRGRRSGRQPGGGAGAVRDQARAASPRR